jgi:hypothetical protein
MDKVSDQNSKNDFPEDLRSPTGIIPMLETRDWLNYQRQRI